MKNWKVALTGLALLTCLAGSAPALTIPDAEAQAAGRRIWMNECGGRIDGLTSWNAGEEFPSLGIGHFIWYPKGPKGRFEESFPKMIASLETQGVKIPGWLKASKECPWNSRQEFLADFNGPRLTELRKLLANSVAQQARFIAARLEATLPKLLEAAPADQRESVRKRFEAVAAAPGGIYALVDYVNFKGEGVNPTERYKGEGWGLLQVLQGMQGDLKGHRLLQAFADSADRALTLRVHNSPPARGEGKFLQGWRNRVHGYAQ